MERQNYKHSILRYTISTVMLFLTVACGSKKKTTEITKEEYKEKKDLSVFSQKNRLSVITFTKDATEMIIEALPYNPLIIGKDTIKGAEKVTYRKTRVDSTAQITEQAAEQVSDKREVYRSKKEKNIEKEKNWSISWRAVVLIIVVGGIIIWARSTSKKIKFWQ